MSSRPAALPTRTEFESLLESGRIRQIQKHDYSQAVDTSTVNTFGESWVENAAANLEAIRSSAGVRGFRNALAGVPFLIVGCGPSLELNIQHIVKAKEKGFFIFCCDNALKLLVEHGGVTPHLVGFMDAQEKVVEFFSGLDTTGLTGLFFAGTHPRVIRAWKGTKLFYNQNAPIRPMRKIFRMLGNGLGALLPGTCVQSVGVSLAMMTRADPVVFAGIDLSFPGGKFYAFREAEAPVQAVTFDHSEQPVATILPFVRSRDWMHWSMTERQGARDKLWINATEGGILGKGLDADSAPNYRQWTLESVVDSISVPKRNLEWELKKIIARGRREALRGASAQDWL